MNNTSNYYFSLLRYNITLIPLGAWHPRNETWSPVCSFLSVILGIGRSLEKSR